MPASARAMALCRDDWTGSVTLSDGINSGVSAPAGTLTAFAIWRTLALAASAHWTVTWSVTDEGLLSYSADTALTLTFSSGLNVALGYDAASYAAATSRTGDYAPWSVIQGPLLYTGADRLPEDSGQRGHGRVSWMRVPAADLRQPEISTTLTPAQTVGAAEAWDALAHPPTLDVFTDGPTLATVFPSRFQSRRASETSLWHRLTINGVLP